MTNQRDTKDAPETVPATAASPTGKRQHVATYANDKKNGGYLVRIAGPHAARFAGREVPVTRLDKSEGTETLEKLIWSGVDTGEYGGKAGEPIALYTFTRKPRAEEVAPF